MKLSLILYCNLTSFYAAARSAVRHENFVMRTQIGVGASPETQNKLVQISRAFNRQP
jgi:hypothetical protein